ncbi:carbohydrate kinase family protein [Acidiferrimicrobium sp. IK]|uniref:carbohydrate kinase family protein n=1 Tax=Acidiferrimicrobium sp. IK TaxID=2871700 RepID=UPI0021CAF0E7|nr:carbohydrate kinase family protein [Acidiferrimicrobium sp. IK]MCU4183311.1 carbohydrate kinase family protein [Acidiferrimicrobium sp. IK]
MIVAYGDALVDVIVELHQPLAHDDDVPATTTMTPGGQGANVAAWVAALGGQASVVTRLGDDANGAWLRRDLEGRGVTVHSPRRPGRTGTVVSLVGADGSRTMASDRGDSADLNVSDLSPGWFAGAEWLHLSGYALLGPAPAAALRASEMARDARARISVDLSSATLVAALGRAEVARRLAAAGATAVFANELEAAAAGAVDAEILVIKRGAGGAELRVGRLRTQLHVAEVVAARDVTGAGDAFAAGWLVGGVEMALEAARRSVAAVGAR